MKKHNIEEGKHRVENGPEKTVERLKQSLTPDSIGTQNRYEMLEEIQDISQS